MKIQNYVTAFLKVVEKRFWHMVYTEQMGMSPNEAGKVMSTFHPAADMQSDWAARFASYKEAQR